MTKKSFFKILPFGVCSVFITAVMLFYLDKSDNHFDFKHIIAISVILIANVITAFLISRSITKNVVNQVDKIAKSFDDIEKVDAYDEFIPLIDTIRLQKDKQKLLDRHKKEFTANVSHELKTPLTSIAGYAELIEMGMASEENIKPFASTIRTQALRLVSLTEDIIKLSQLEEVENEIVFEEADIYDIASKALQALEVNAKAKNITLEMQGSNCFIKGNKTLLDELVYNLIDNAIRYNKNDGSVVVKAERQGKRTYLTVKDTGIGIPEKYKQRVFERFFRVDKSRSKETGGTGLGLAIVKHIVEVHGADIKIASEENVGTQIDIIFE